MKKYLVLRIWPFWVDGIKYHDQYLSEFMELDGVSTVFACPKYAPSSFSSFTGMQGSIKNNYNMIFLSYFNILGKPLPFRLFKFKNEILSLNPDVIHIFGISNFTSIFALIAAKLASFKGIIIFNDHSDPNERKYSVIAKFYYNLFYFFYRILIRNKYTIIVPDISARDELIRRYGQSIKSVIKIIPLGYDDRTFYTRAGLRNPGVPLIIGFAGKIFPEKRLELLIDAVGYFESSEIKLYIAGLNKGKPSSYQCKLIEYINSSPHRNIEIYKFISTSEELASFYSALDVAIFPGSISITTFEANGCGCPIILYASLDGLEHRVSPSRGRLFKDPVELVEYIKQYLDIKRSHKIDHARIEFETKEYSWKRIKLEYYEHYGFKNTI